MIGPLAEAWRWYYDVVGDKRCAIVDTFWQTETGGFMLTPMPGSHTLKPGSCTLPMFGVEPKVLDPTTGKELEGNDVAGVLVFAKSWPSMLRTAAPRHATLRRAPCRMNPTPVGREASRKDDRSAILWWARRLFVSRA